MAALGNLIHRWLVFQLPAYRADAPQENSDLEVDMTSEDEDGTASES